MAIQVARSLQMLIDVPIKHHGYLLLQASFWAAIQQPISNTMVVDASDAGSKSAIGPHTTSVLLIGTQQTESGIYYVGILQVSPTVSQPICQAERALGNKIHVSDSSNPISESPQQEQAP